MEYYQKKDYEVLENSICRICEGIGIPVSEVMELENEQKVNLRQSEVPVVLSIVNGINLINAVCRDMWMH